MSKAKDIFFNNLFILIELKHGTKCSFAKAVDIHQTTVSTWFIRGTIPSSEMLDKIAKHFDVKVCDLFNEEVVFEKKISISYRENENE